MFELDLVLIDVLCLWFFVFGSCVGSFLNVFVYRFPRRESLVHPPSHCLHCGHSIRWYDNIPVIGWIKLRGKCRDCQMPISFRYPCVEGFVGILFGSVFYLLTHFLNFQETISLGLLIGLALFLSLLGTSILAVCLIVYINQ